MKMGDMIPDERSPCEVCIVNRNCTDYCNTFDYYRRLVLAEVDYYFAQCMYDYDKDKSETRMMTDIERELDVAYRLDVNSYKEYNEVKNNLQYLVDRFDVIIANSQRANRGVAMQTVTIQNAGTSHVKFMKQAFNQISGG